MKRALIYTFLSVFGASFAENTGAPVLGASTSSAGGNVRLTNDTKGGYVSIYTLATGVPYTDSVLSECAISRGRQNEPSVAVNPRDPRVIIGSSNDYCGVYQNGVPVGPIWLGYYRSENGGASFQSSLVPGYPGDTSPYAALAQIRTASSGDPVIAWDNHGRVFMGSESSEDPAGTKKSFGDMWVATFDNPGGESIDTRNDGKRFVRSVIVETGSSAPNLGGKFNDKTAIEADRTASRCEGNVYFAWSRFTGFGGNAMYFSRSTDHGATWSAPNKLSSGNGVQYADIAITGNGHVYVTYHQYPTNADPRHVVAYNRSTDCGRSFGPTQVVASFETYDAQDVSAPNAAPAFVADDPFSDADARTGIARDCGDFGNHCQSGYTFFRHDTQVRSTADPTDQQHEYVYIVFDPSKPGTEVATGTTYGSIQPGLGSQGGIFFVRLDGATDAVTTPALIDDQPVGHQIFPDISADRGILHVIWWDSRFDPAYSPARPIGNDSNGFTVPSLDVFATRSTDAGNSWTPSVRLTSVSSNGNYEQFSNRTVPFAGDYLWVSSVGDLAFATWTDWRNTVAGVDPREGPTSDGADVRQCRTFNPATGTWSGDQCPHAGGIDQNIYGSRALSFAKISPTPLRSKNR